MYIQHIYICMDTYSMCRDIRVCTYTYIHQTNVYILYTYKQMHRVIHVYRACLYMSVTEGYVYIYIFIHTQTRIPLSVSAGATVGCGLPTEA